MDVFSTAINQLGILFIFIIIGFIMKKSNIFSDNTSSVLSKLENYLFMPAVIINTFLKKCTIENLQPRLVYLLVSFLVIIVLTIMGIFLCGFFSKDHYEQMIYRYSLVIPNFAFMGNAIAQGVFGDTFLFDYLIYTIPLNIVCYSIGVAWLKPDKDSKITWKNFVNPTMIAVVIGIILGITSMEKVIPAIFENALTTTASCMSPIAMILTGFVIGEYNIRKLLSNEKVYILCLARLIAIPFAVVLVLQLFHVDYELIKLALCSMCMPLGLNTIIIPAAYDENADIGASMALISNVMAILTIPLMFMTLL